MATHRQEEDRRLPAYSIAVLDRSLVPLDWAYRSTCRSRNIHDIVIDCRPLHGAVSRKSRFVPSAARDGVGAGHAISRLACMQGTSVSLPRRRLRTRNFKPQGAFQLESPRLLALATRPYVSAIRICPKRSDLAAAVSSNGTVRFVKDDPTSYVPGPVTRNVSMSSPLCQIDGCEFSAGDSHVLYGYSGSSRNLFCFDAVRKSFSAMASSSETGHSALCSSERHKDAVIVGSKEGHARLLDRRLGHGGTPSSLRSQETVRLQDPRLAPSPVIHVQCDTNTVAGAGGTSIPGAILSTFRANGMVSVYDIRSSGRPIRSFSLLQNSRMTLRGSHFLFRGRSCTIDSFVPHPYLEGMWAVHLRSDSLWRVSIDGTNAEATETGSSGSICFDWSALWLSDYDPTRYETSESVPAWAEIAKVCRMEPSFVENGRSLVAGSILPGQDRAFSFGVFSPQSGPLPLLPDEVQALIVSVAEFPCSGSLVAGTTSDELFLVG